ncbi:MAG: M42 family metallopeptidase [Solitalea-like symbiont of Acarus siro]
MKNNKEKPVNKIVVNEKSLDFFKKYINNASPTGFEESGQKLWLDYLKPYTDKQFIDDYGNAVAVINPDNPYKVVIEAHADEISWFVNYITDKGLIYVIRNGGSDHQIAPSKTVNVHTKKGLVKGVFGWPAIHTRKSDKEENPQLKNIFIDVGCSSKEEVEELGIHVGSVITYDDEFKIINDNYYVGRAMDNRAGGFMIAEVARLLHEGKNNLPYALYIVNAVQEEVGLYGAKIIANRINPNLAIVTDVTHDTSTPMICQKTHGDTQCNKGPVVSYAPAVQRNFNDFVIETANMNNIPFQRQASSRSTGTDTDSFAYSNNGVTSTLISLPLRYMHTTVEMVHKNDVNNVISLIYNVLLRINGKENFKYFNI